MTASPFKSSSRRAKPAEQRAPVPSAASRRRSQSVTAVSRRTFASTEDDPSISAEFSNSRDNPLFWARHSSPIHEEDPSKKPQKFPYVNRSCSSKSRKTNNVDCCRDFSGERTGRSLIRGSYEKKGIGRSLSRVLGEPISEFSCRRNNQITEDTGSFLARGRGGSEGNCKNTGITNLDKDGEFRNLETYNREKNQKLVSNWCDDYRSSWRALNSEDIVSASSFSETEGKSIKDVQELREKPAREMSPNGIHEALWSELRQAISDIEDDDLHSLSGRKDANLVSEKLVDAPSSSLKSDADEYTHHIRRDYAMKLEESELWAEKLRSDLAIEELRQQELDRILRETHIYSKHSLLHRSPQGKISNERKAMSKQLTEDAFTYFDECVSLSTFDSSDFSAPEDPVCGFAGPSMPSYFSYSAKRSSRTSLLHEESCDFPLKQMEVDISYGDSDSSPSINSKIPAADSEFPYSDNKLGDRCFEGTRYDAGEYSNCEGFLIDKVMFNSRILTGRLLLCDCSMS